jgi:hypothetical protein
VSRLSEDASFAFELYVDRIVAMVFCWKVTLSVVAIIPIALVTLGNMRS